MILKMAFSKRTKVDVLLHNLFGIKVLDYCVFGSDGFIRVLFLNYNIRSPGSKTFHY